jgi:signal transduction histidine kinase
MNRERGRASTLLQWALGLVLCVACGAVALGEVATGPAHTVGSLVLIPVLLAAWLLSTPGLAVVGAAALVAIAADTVERAITLETALAQAATVAVVAVLAALAKASLRRQRLSERRANELAAAQERQEQMRRAKTRFLLTISHELRTPLTVIRGYLSLLDDGNLPDSVWRTAIHTANVKATELQSLIKQLLEGFDPEDRAATAWVPESRSAIPQPELPAKDGQESERRPLVTSDSDR